MWRDYFETSQELQRQIGARFQAQSGISMSDYTVMVSLNEAEDHTLRSSELAAKIAWDRSRLSHHLRRMEGRGLIRREACSHDSRGSYVVLTEEGMALYRRASVPHLADVGELFVDAFTPEQLDAFGAAVAALRKHLDSPTSSPSSR